MSGPIPEPQAPSFERMRSIAKHLTRDCRAGDLSAVQRVQAQLPGLAGLDAVAVAARVRLADVQHALAREAGVENWAALKVLIQSQEPMLAQLARFLRALPGGDRSTMLHALTSHPEIARTSIHAACAAGDAVAVESWLARDGSLAVQQHAGGGWRPLDCLAASPLFDVDDAHRAASVSIGTRLLALGADPNLHTTSAHGDPHAKLTALYRASERGNAGLVRLLLERGANPNDGESVYHSAERNHRDVLELLLAHGAEISARQLPWNNTVLYYLAGFRDEHVMAPRATEGMRWLLEHGADPNVGSYDHGETPLHRVAEFGRGVGVAELLLAHGADPRAARADGRTAYELAMRSGNAAVAGLLRERGAAVTELRLEDAFLAAIAAGDQATALSLRAAHPELFEGASASKHHAIVHAAESGNVKAVQVLVALGVDLRIEGPWGGTALHQAAWRGRVELARALVAAGAPLNVRDKTYGSSPIAWAAHGSANCRDADDDYIAVIDVLLEAGPEREPSFNKWGEPPEALASERVADHLRARGFAPWE